MLDYKKDARAYELSANCGDRAMFRQSARINGQTVLTPSGSALYERRHAGPATEHTRHVQANGRTVATVKREGTSSTNTTRYLH